MTKELLKYREDEEKKVDKKLVVLLLAYKQALDLIRHELGYMYVINAKDGVIKASSKKQYNLIVKDIEKIMKEQAKILGDIELKLTKEIHKVAYKDTYNRTLEILKTSNIKLDENLLDKIINTKVEGKLFSDRIWKNKELLVKRLRKDIKSAITKGESIDTIANNIQARFNTSANESKRLVINQMARVLVSVQTEIYKKDDRIKYVRYDATIDSKTSEMCLALHGSVFEADSDYPRPVLDTHVNCRSVIVPIIVKK